ncbi:TcpD family membrane protein [Enterococcus sp. LJL128]
MITLSRVFETVQSEGQYILYIIIFWKMWKEFKNEKWLQFATTILVGGLCIYILGAPDSLSSGFSYIGDLLFSKK